MYYGIGSVVKTMACLCAKHSWPSSTSQATEWKCFLGTVQPPPLLLRLMKIRDLTCARLVFQGNEALLSAVLHNLGLREVKIS